MLNRLILILFVGLTSSLNAQFNVGFSTGLVGSQVSGDGIYGFNQFGVRAGAFSRYNFNDQWSIDVGIYYTQKGSRKWKNKNSFNTYRLRIHYIDVPILVNYSFKKFMFQIGPSINTYVGHKEVDDYGPVGVSRSFKRVELSIDAHINYYFNSNFWLGLHFSNSITPIRPHTIGQSYLWNLGQYNTLLSLNIGYLLKPFSH